METKDLVRLRRGKYLYLYYNSIAFVIQKYKDFLYFKIFLSVNINLTKNQPYGAGTYDYFFLRVVVFFFAAARFFL